MTDAAVIEDFRRGNNPHGQTTASAETDASQNCATHRIQTRPQFAPALNAQDAKNFRTPKIAISLLGEQELQDSGLKRAKAMAMSKASVKSPRSEKFKSPAQIPE